MNTNTHHMARRFERHIANTTTDLPRLEEEIDHIGGAAHAALHSRLHNVEIMEHALRRNLDEVIQSETRPPAKRVRNLRRLCRCIEKESEDLRHEVEFLDMGSASTLVALVEGSSALISRGLKMLSKLSSRTLQPR
ncbi:MAG: hypothetical protein U0984_14960 [Prosthecobacter sp.]|nr:hypothetical protein [Prosthecobacter sp.]